MLNSYDVCSNQIGIALFINTYNDLSSGRATWVDVINELCNDVEITIPENAPNYEYIPHIIDGNYPRNFSSNTCLIGESLEVEAKKAFCNRDIITQLNILEVHAIFPH